MSALAVALWLWLGAPNAHDACVRSAVLFAAERAKRPAHWSVERTWELCWRTPGACAVEGCP